MSVFVVASQYLIAQHAEWHLEQHRVVGALAEKVDEGVGGGGAVGVVGGDGGAIVVVRSSGAREVTLRRGRSAGRGKGRRSRRGGREGRGRGKFGGCRSARFAGARGGARRRGGARARAHLQVLADEPDRVLLDRRVPRRHLEQGGARSATGSPRPHEPAPAGRHSWPRDTARRTQRAEFSRSAPLRSSAARRR